MSDIPTDLLAPGGLHRFRYAGVTYDQEDGIAAVSDVKNVHRSGFVIFVKASTFLDLVPTEGIKPDLYRDAVRQDLALSMPFVSIDLDDDPVRVRSHEGRHRVTAILAEKGDILIPLAVLLDRGWRAVDVEPRHLQRLRDGVFTQRDLHNKSRFVTGPLFEDAIVRGERFCADAQLASLPDLR